MEYEQLERGNRVITQCIYRQDLNQYNELLSPNVILVNHFPLPANTEHISKANSPALKEVAQTIELLSTSALPMNKLRVKYLRNVEEQLYIQQERYDTQRVVSYTGANYNGNTSSNNINSSVNGLSLHAPMQGNVTLTASNNTNNKTNKSKELSSNQKKTKGKEKSSVNCKSGKNATNTKFDEKHSRESVFVEQYLQDAVKGEDDNDKEDKNNNNDNDGSVENNDKNRADFKKKANVSVKTNIEREVAANTISVENNKNCTVPNSRAAEQSTRPLNKKQKEYSIKKISNPVNTKCNSKNNSSNPSWLISYSDFVDIAEGKDLVSAHFGYLLCWLNQRPYLAETKVNLEARKGILQDNEVLPPPPKPATEQAKFELIGEQFTTRNQMLSRLTITYGSEFLLFQDQCYFNEGYIVTIHRKLLPLSQVMHKVAQLRSQHPFLTEPKPKATQTTTTNNIKATLATQSFSQQEQQINSINSSAVTQSQQMDAIRREIVNLYNLAAHPLRAVNSSWPMLDFSFVDCSDIAQLLLQMPCDGKVHQIKIIRPRVDPRWAQGVFLNAENDPMQYKENDRILIKAKNKRGDEEAYEFEKEGHRFEFMLDGKDDDRANGANGGRGGSGKNNIPVEVLINNRKFKYDACTVRVSGCKLQSRIDKFVPIMRGLVANALMTIHSLDLSDNQLSTLPDLSSLPLQKLQLHSNKISDWSEVERKVCTLPYLYAVTLHGNPLSEFDKSYWPRLLALLIGNDRRRVALKQVDFVTLTLQDFNVAASYAAFITGNTTVRQAVQSMKKENQI